MKTLTPPQDLWKTWNDNANQQLLDSLIHLSEHGIDETLVRLNTKGFHPFTFLAYSNLVEAIQSEKDTKPFVHTVNSSLRLNRPDSLESFFWQDDHFSKGEWEQLLSSMGKEAVFPRDLETPESNSYTLLSTYVESSLDYLKENFSPYHDLVTSNLNTLVLASPGPISRKWRMNFGGATYFFFWGGTVINSQLLTKFETFFEQLVHESLHMTLFMACNEFGPLCENPDSETFSSAFRSDRRPMHGVFHAYFVAQNLSNCFQNLNKSSSTFEAIAKKNANSARILRSEILRNARLTPIGECILSHPLITDPSFCELIKKG